MSTPLDDILSRREPASEQQETTTPESPVAEPERAEPQAEAQPETHEEPEGGKAPPIGAIRTAEREKAAKRYTEQVADFERKLDDQNRAWESRFNALLTQLRPPQEPPQRPDIFENPEAAVLHTMAPHLSQVREAMTYNSRLVAEQLHKPDVVQQAEQAFVQAHSAGQVDPADAQRVLRSPNIYDAAVRWHKRQTILAEIGDDPAAYRERLKAEILAEQQQPAAQPATPVMPSNFAQARNVGNRTGPTWAGPAPLTDIFDRRKKA